MHSSKLFVVLFILAVFVGNNDGYCAKKNQDSSSETINKKENDDEKLSEYQLLEIFGSILERVKAEHAEPLDNKKLIQSALKGMLKSMDPHSDFYTEEEYKEITSDIDGRHFGGIGVQVLPKDGEIMIVAALDGTPGEKAGLQNKDIITHVDGKSIKGMNPDSAINLMRGEPGTSVELTILRGKKSPFKVKITRQKIDVNPVRGKLEGKIAYIRIATFINQKTAEYIKKAYEKIVKELGSEPEGIVIDVRLNPGGLLEQGIEVSDLFLEKGQEIVSSRGREEGDIQRYYASDSAMAKGVPMVVLVDGGSASASEIFAGAMQDHKRGIVVGEKTWGKGSVQVVFPIKNLGGVRFTTARYYTPSGRSIQAKGVEPDIKIPLAKIEKIDMSSIGSEAETENILSAETDGEKTKAKDKKSSLDTADKKEDKTSTQDDLKVKDKKSSDGEDDDETAAEAVAVDENLDYQLEFALNLVRGLALDRANRFKQKS